MLPVPEIARIKPSARQSLKPSPRWEPKGFLLLAWLAASVCAEDWPKWRGPDLNGISQEKGWLVQWPQDGLKQLWKASVGTGFSSVVVSQGKLFTLGHAQETDTVFCLDAETGRELWKYSYAAPLDAKYYEGGPGATPTVDGASVYTLSKRGRLFCFNALSGKVEWEKNVAQELGAAKPEWGFASSPWIDGNMILLNMGHHGVALDKAKGEIIWSSGKEVSSYATVVPATFGSARCGLIFCSKALSLVNLKTGQELWRHTWVSGWDINAADPIVSGDKVFISSWDQGGAVLQISPSKHEVVWKNKEMGNHFNSCVLLDGHLYGVNGNTDRPGRHLRCLDFSTGTLKWSYEGLGLGSLMAADGKLIILSDKGELVIAEATPAAFRPLARAQVLGGKCWTTPVLANGLLYCRNAQGMLICLDLRGKTPASRGP